MRFVSSFWTMLAAALAASVAGCGSKSALNADAAGAGGATSGGAGGDTGGQAGGDQSSSTGVTSTGVAGGPACGDGVPVTVVSTGDEPCACDGSFVVQVQDECGSYALDDPFPTDQVNCDVQVPYAVASECKGTHFSLAVLACADPLTSPCLSIQVSQSPDGAESSGGWIDAAGNLWTLSDVQMPGALPWTGGTAKGTFTATATYAGATQQIQGEYYVCIATAAICPI